MVEPSKFTSNPERQIWEKRQISSVEMLIDIQREIESKFRIGDG